MTPCGCGDEVFRAEHLFLYRTEDPEYVNNENDFMCEDCVEAVEYFKAKKFNDADLLMSPGDHKRAVERARKKARANMKGLRTLKQILKEK